ncbi:prolipoprotein diacylglyceryl transferase [Patescibacteria group bacterium]|nr:prolipoprotein diacylglyceryl transferase [Patescibacteria group bacterium]
MHNFMFLHTLHPRPILISFGPINIYWYGLLVVLGILAAIAVTLKLSSYYNIKKEVIIDLAFYLVIFGIIGARLYDVLLELPYYLNHPFDVFKIWQGGLAIHGAIIAGIITIWLFAKKRELNPWLAASIIVPGLALAQAIGRWGNYFNQELFGKPTGLSWGIPIDLMNRPIEYISYEFFHPTFLYESIGSFIIFIVLIFLHFLMIKKTIIRYELSVMSYTILYSILRFSTEFIRIDKTPVIFNLRFPQIASLVIIFLSVALLLLPKIKSRVNIQK